MASSRHVRVEIEALLSMGLANSPMAGAKIRVASGNFVTARPLGIHEGVDYQHTGEVRRIDADGINAIPGTEALRRRAAPSLITPHRGEFRRLTDLEADYRSARELASTSGTVVLLKGSPTFVAGEQLWAVTSGGAELATIGTGDVLTGLAAALWARGLDPETAARSAAYWHGRAGAALVERGTLTAEGLAAGVGRFAW